MVTTRGTKLLSSRSVQQSTFRGYRNIFHRRTVLITGASRGVGYAVIKDLSNRLTHPNIYCTTRNSADQLTGLIREEVESSKAKLVRFKKMDVTNIVSVVDLRNHIYAKMGQIDILVNNAGVYYHPTNNPEEHFVQVQDTLATNYWGLKNVINAFLPMLSDNARIVNMSSNLSDVKLVPNLELRKKFASRDLTERELDNLMLDYQRNCTEFNNDFDVMGYPRCSYTLSKIAVNAYTRILQKQLIKRGDNDIVVNSVWPGSYHSKITKDGESSLPLNMAARMVTTTALLPDSISRPKGEFICHSEGKIEFDTGTLPLEVGAAVSY